VSCAEWDYREHNYEWHPTFALSTLLMANTRQFGYWRLNGESTALAVFSTTQNPLFEAPVLRSFSDAMNTVGLRALDATVVFLAVPILVDRTENDTLPYQVIYPQNDKVAPIPRPVVFVSPDATDEDLKAMLTDHAPRIFAYNKLFNEDVLPSVLQLDALLKKFAAEDPIVAKLIEKVGIENARNALHAAHLKMAYAILSGILAPAEFVGRAAVGIAGAPLALGAMLSRPVFRKIFIDYMNDSPNPRREGQSGWR
jgi:hypothetical protein